MAGTNNKATASLAMAAVASLLQVGCQTVPPRAADYTQSSPAISPQSAPPPQVMAQQPVMPQSYPQPYTMQPYPNMQAVETANLELKERLDRVEKAMLRLDRRMQLIERNELGRMSSGGSPQDADSITGRNEERAAMQSLNITPAAVQQPEDAAAQAYRDGFQPVAATDGTIRSSLQAAPRALGSMPSLADTAPAAGRAPQAAENVAIWTVRYEPEKVWPDRAQLPTSRGIVEALRGNSNTTLFARGSNPNSNSFRERVKALSRYLAKVSSQESVPIAALPAPHLDGETIEILATH